MCSPRALQRALADPIAGRRTKRREEELERGWWEMDPPLDLRWAVSLITVIILLDFVLSSFLSCAHRPIHCDSHSKPQVKWGRFWSTFYIEFQEKIKLNVHSQHRQSCTPPTLSSSALVSLRRLWRNKYSMCNLNIYRSNNRLWYWWPFKLLLHRLGCLSLSDRVGSHSRSYRSRCTSRRCLSPVLFYF